jgi:MFS family permease
VDKTLEQIRKLLLIKGFLGYETILAPVIATFYIKYVGLSFSQYAFLESLLTILIAFFEIPSGYLADRLGRKKLYLISQICYIFSKVIVCMFPSFLVAIACTMIAGVSLSMSSGNLEAVYYEAFATEDKVDDLKRLYGKAASLTFITSIFTSIIGGYLASIQIALPIIVDTTVIAIDVLFTWWLLKEAPGGQKVERFIGNFGLITFKETFGTLFRYKGLILFTLISSLVFATLRVSYTFYQPYMQSSGVELEYFGLVFAGFNIVSAAFSFLNNKLINYFSSEKK